MRFESDRELLVGMWPGVAKLVGKKSSWVVVELGNDS